MGVKKNPFEVFGVTPELAHRLQAEELFTLIKAIYRNLQKLYHPDLAPNNGRKENQKRLDQATELNLAFEELNLDKNKDSFRHHHKLYAARRNKGLRKKISILEGGLKKIEEGKDALADCFMDHVLDQISWKNPHNTAKGRGRNHFLPHPRLVSLGLNDVAINYNLRHCSWDVGSNYKEISFDQEGRMSYRPVGRSKKRRINYIHLLGAIDVESIELIPILNQRNPRPNYYKGPAYNNGFGVNGVGLEVTNAISMENFKKHCLQIISPELKERSYLFSIQRPVFEETANVSVEGVIVKVSDV